MAFGGICRTLKIFVVANRGRWHHHEDASYCHRADCRLVTSDFGAELVNHRIRGYLDGGHY